MYGLDLDSLEYLTDRQGNQTKVVVPKAMFSALVEFWCAARRAQTANIEARARPGQFKTSLGGFTPHAPDMPAAPAPAFKADSRWSQLLDRLPEADLPEAPPEDNPPPHESTVISRKRQTFFAREFISPPPPEVMKAISCGMYFLRAWREYRKLTRQDTADLFGKSVATIGFHEQGYHNPNEVTLRRFAEVFDCPIEQLTFKPGSNTKPWLTLISNPEAPKELMEPTAPEDTDYPDAVLAHLLAGKSPLTAWRLYRGLTLTTLGDIYGTSGGNIKAMEAAGFLRTKTITKMCPILKCRPEQLLRPEGMDEHQRAETPASRRITQAMRAHA